MDVRSGKVELGQGVLTALAQVAAEELDVNVDRVRMVAAVTGVSPDEGYTSGSMSIQYSGAALRRRCAEARAIYLGVAAARWNLPAELITVQDGTMAAPDGRTTSYWELADDGLLDRPATGRAEPKAASGYRVVGTSVPRMDLPDKLAPRPRFVHDLALDGMLYGRVVRPPSRAATLIDVGAEPVMALSGVVTVVRDGSFLGVIAEREEVALRAADLLRAEAKWQEQPSCPTRTTCPPSSPPRPRRPPSWPNPILPEGAPPGPPRARTTPPITGPTSRTRRWDRPARRRWPGVGRGPAGGLDAQPGRVPAARCAGPGARAGRGPGARAARRRCGLLRPQRRRRRRPGRGPARPGRARPAGAGGLVARRRAWLGAATGRPPWSASPPRSTRAVTCCPGGTRSGGTAT